MARYIDIEGAGIGKANREQFLVPEFADGWNAVLKILEKEPTADVVETKRISEILAVLFENNIVEKYIPNTANAGSWEDFLRKACSGEYGMDGDEDEL